jgi:hypothetical protein
MLIMTEASVPTSRLNFLSSERIPSLLNWNGTYLFYQLLDKCQVAINTRQMKLCFSFLILPNFETYRPARLIWMTELLILTLRICSDKNVIMQRKALHISSELDLLQGLKMVHHNSYSQLSTPQTENLPWNSGVHHTKIRLAIRWEKVYIAHPFGERTTEYKIP